MTFSRAQVVGAGLAGLSAAVALAHAGVAVALSDGANRAGGRCRSYHDPQLGLTIDNGNHLVLSGNAAAMRFRDTVGADPGTLVGPAHADFAFADLRSGERWTVGINDGRLPWWVLSPRRRVPGTRARDYLAPLRLLGRGDVAIGERLRPQGKLWERLLDPVLVSVLNVEAASGSSALAAAVLAETMGAGGRASRPLVAHPSLAAAFVDPAVAWLSANGAAPAFGRRLRALAFERDRVAALDWGAGAEAVGADEAVVLALPAWAAAALVPDLIVPNEHRAIVNGHFAWTPPVDAPPILGLIGGTAEWVFALPDRVSVTVSAADALVDDDREGLARRFWADIQAAYRTDAPLPRWQVVKEKRATFAATPAQNALRPPAATRWRNLFLAGDWTRTGLPATIEGAIRSGETAAGLVASPRLPGTPANR